ncbi:hypothetical protein JCM14469_41060 [Desulfatiferula olefinivorans]
MGPPPTQQAPHPSQAVLNPLPSSLVMFARSMIVSFNDVTPWGKGPTHYLEYKRSPFHGEKVTFGYNLSYRVMAAART